MNKTKKYAILSLVFAVLMATCMVRQLSAAGLNNGLKLSLDLSVGDLNGNGRADVTELPERMTVSAMTPNGASVVSDVQGDDAYEHVSFQTFDVIDPYWGLNSKTNTRPCLYFPQSKKTDGTDTYSAAQFVKYPTSPVKTMQSCTVFARFRWSGNTYASAHNIVIAMNGYGWTKGNGWGVGLYGNAANESTAEILCLVGQGSVRTKGVYSVDANKWYDVVYTIKYGQDGSSAKVDLHVVQEDSVKKPEVAHFTYEITGKTMANPTTSGGFWIGGENSSDVGWQEISVNAAKNVFRGAIAELKVWDRVLSDNEVMMVFNGAVGTQWTIGAENGSADEFGAVGKLTYSVGADLWADFPKGLTGDRKSVTIVSAWPAPSERMSQILTIAPLLSGGAEVSCPVDVLVNGSIVASVDLADNAQRELRIGKEFVRRDADGNLSVSICRRDAIGSLAFDWLSLSGSFMIGIADDKNSEFATSRDTHQTFVVGDPSNKHFVDSLWHVAAKGSETGLNVSSMSNGTVLAYLPSAAVRESLRFKLRINCGQPPCVHKIGFFVNGIRKATWIGSGKNVMESFEYRFEANELSPGLVEFMLSDEGVFPGVEIKNRWAYIDYVALDAVGNSKGLVLLFR